jgi:serine/threonine protein kinase
MSDSLRNKILDNRYQLGALIGKGGMGQVYEAVHVGVGRKVAVKTLREDIALTPRSISRLQREARIAGSIGHDHICEVIDTGTDEDGLPYLVMPLLKGRTLKSLLDAEAPLSAARSVHIAVRILEGLDAAHAQCIVHRDLKPGNVFLTKVGNQDDFVKILDFGVSKRLDRSESCELTKSGAVLGTPLYMSPEQAGGALHIDRRADIYAVGVLLYEMLTGVRPFKGDSYNEIITRIAGASFSAPIALNKAVSKLLNRIVLKAMARNPDDRFASAKQMLTALRALKPSDLTGFSAELSFTQSGERAPFGVSPRAAVFRKNKHFAGIAVVCSLALIVSARYAIVHDRSHVQDSCADAKAASPPLRSTLPVAEVPPPAVSRRAVALPEDSAGVAPTSPPTAAGEIEVLLENDNPRPKNDNPSQKRHTVGPRRRKASGAKAATVSPRKKSVPSSGPAAVFTGKKDTLFSEDYGR